MAGTQPPVGRRGWSLGVVLVCCALVMTSCRPAADVPTSGAADSQAAAAATLQPEDVVDLTLYFRHGSGPSAYLAPVVREVPVADDLPRRAVELLLAGPDEGDDAALAAPLPTSTAVLGFEVVEDVAHLDLSREVITDRATVSASADHELLGLAAIANTLTEFPTLDHVELTVAGADDGVVDGVDIDEFWGWWGLPERLDRDDSVIGPPAEDATLPDISDFSSDTQTVGSEDAPGVTLANLRAHSRATYLRITAALADPTHADVMPAVPLTSVRRTPRGLLLKVMSVGGYGDDLAAGQPTTVDDPSLDEIRVDRSTPGTARIHVMGDAVSDFRLLTLTDPTRVVLDIRK